MNQNQKTSWLDNIKGELETISYQLDETIEKKKSRLKFSKKQIELESQLIQQRILSEELTMQLQDLCQRNEDVDSICARIKASMKITDSDQHKLENAREQYQLAKELTGIRFDFEYCSEHPNATKGYLKNESKHLLESFEFEKNSDALWEIVANIFQVHHQENRPRNHK